LQKYVSCQWAKNKKESFYFSEILDFIFKNLNICNKIVKGPVPSIVPQKQDTKVSDGKDQGFSDHKRWVCQIQKSVSHWSVSFFMKGICITSAFHHDMKSVKHSTPEF
jgi:hypothetical protein